MQRAVELNPRRLAFRRYKIRPVQQLARFLQARTSSIRPRHPRGRKLNGRPVNQFGYRRDQSLNFEL
jgi:hypothetical protein